MQIYNKSIKELKCLTAKKISQNKNIQNQLKLLNETIIHIVHITFQTNAKTCNDKDPPWLNDHISRVEGLILFIKACKPLHGI